MRPSTAAALAAAVRRRFATTTTHASSAAQAAAAVKPATPPLPGLFGMAGLHAPADWARLGTEAMAQ